MSLPEVDDFQRLFCEQTPLLDVRAPVEFKQGAFPNTSNIALLNDAEREQIGIRYKENGHEAAVELGAELIQGEIKAGRIMQWKTYIEQNPNTVLYCFRGGMRSQITQQWIFEETGISIPRVKGGYKALRRYLIDQTDYLAAKTEPLILSGRTGSGKTVLINKLKHMIDLEGLANHRGSSIGRQISPQPTQIGFENSVAIALIELHHAGIRKIILEDESPNIGSVHIPHALYDKMRQAPCVVLESSLDERIDITLKEYVTNMLKGYQDQAEDSQVGFIAFSDYLRNSLERVQRRLGGQRYQEILSAMNEALVLHRETGKAEGHKQWLGRMLEDYYDPMYDYQQQQRQRSTEKTATFDEMLRHLSGYC